MVRPLMPAPVRPPKWRREILFPQPICAEVQEIYRRLRHPLLVAVTRGHSLCTCSKQHLRKYASAWQRNPDGRGKLAALLCLPSVVVEKNISCTEVIIFQVHFCVLYNWNIRLCFPFSNWNLTEQKSTRRPLVGWIISFWEPHFLEQLSLPHWVYIAQQSTLAIFNHDALSEWAHRYHN